MNEQRLKSLLEAVAAGRVPIEEALGKLRHLPFEDLGFAKLDHHRALRRGFPETILCSGKTPAQVIDIVARMHAHGGNVLATRCPPETAEALCAAHPEGRYHEAARAFTLTVEPPAPLDGYVAVVCAGTSDIPVAEEAAITCESTGTAVKRVYDVGVAGIHRVLVQYDALEQANALIVCAGMEGALASVVGGLVSKPVIAVPTSIGYGASFQGVAALLTMLNACATGIAVVNIDNGFGAGMFAAMVNRLAQPAV